MSGHSPRSVELSESGRAARADLTKKPDGVLEAIAEKHGLALRDVLGLLPPGQAFSIHGAVFEEVWQQLTSWGDVLFLIHNCNGVFEIKTALPPGTHRLDYFNIHGDGPLSGHLRADLCQSIWFVDRLFFGRRSCSIQFLDAEGEAMFKIYVRRDAERELDSEQLERFETLKVRFSREESSCSF